MHRERLRNYIEEQFRYNYKNLIDEEKGKGDEELKKIYQKWFLKPSYAHAGLDKMTKRVQKHLCKETTDSLTTICREMLRIRLNNRILSVLPDKKIW